MPAKNKLDPVFIVQKRRKLAPGVPRPSMPWVNFKTDPDRAVARKYAATLNKSSKVFEYRVDPARVTPI